MTIESCPDCHVIPTPHTCGPWVVFCENCDWDDRGIPCFGVGLTQEAAVNRWNREAAGRGRDLEGGEADPPRCLNFR